MKGQSVRKTTVITLCSVNVNRKSEERKHNESGLGLVKSSKGQKTIERTPCSKYGGTPCADSQKYHMFSCKNTISSGWTGADSKC